LEAIMSSWLRLRTAIARIAVARVTSEWRAAPRITVVPTSAQFPIPNAPADAAGLYFRQQVFLSADQPDDQLQRVLAHEVIGHHAVRQTFGGLAWRRLVLGVHRAAQKGTDTMLRALRCRVRRNYADANMRPSVEGDEIVAALAEQVFDPRTGRILVHEPELKMGEAAIAYVAREHLKSDRPVTSRELEGVLLLSEHSLRHGSLFWGIPLHVRRTYYRAAVAVAGLTWICWALV
jgi:hypothetical protein